MYTIIPLRLTNAVLKAFICFYMYPQCLGANDLIIALLCRTNLTRSILARISNGSGVQSGICAAAPARGKVGRFVEPVTAQEGTHTMRTTMMLEAVTSAIWER